MTYRVDLLFVTKNTQTWKNTITLVDGKIPTSREERNKMLENIASCQVEKLGDDLVCVGCKTPMTDTRAVAMIHYYPDTNILYGVISYCCARDDCGQEASGQATERWRIERECNKNSGLTLYRTCAHCHRNQEATQDFKVCGRCKATHYCSIACQTQAWKEHKKICFDAKKKKQ